MKREYPRNGIKKDIKNEEQIKNCDIFINDEKIEFGYYYEFPKEGEYTDIYRFHTLLKSTDFMFYKCIKLPLISKKSR